MTADPANTLGTPIFDTLLTELGLDWPTHTSPPTFSGNAPNEQAGWFEPNAATK